MVALAKLFDFAIRPGSGGMGLPLLFKGERLRFCLFLCNIRLTDASESFNRFEISTFL